MQGCQFNTTLQVYGRLPNIVYAYHTHLQCCIKLAALMPTMLYYMHTCYFFVVIQQQM